MDNQESISPTFHMHTDPKSAKKYSQAVNLFALLGFSRVKTDVKAACKMLMKSTPLIFRDDLPQKWMCLCSVSCDVCNRRGLHTRRRVQAIWDEKKRVKINAGKLKTEAKQFTQRTLSQK